MVQQDHMLRTAFIAGAVTDALALVPLVVAPAAKLLWGFEDAGGEYRFAMGYAASLMLGWTALLVWACQRPIERRFVAALTVIVICGLILTEVVAVLSGALAAWRLAPTWGVQAVLLALFGIGYFYPALRRKAAREGETS
jgi:hypothetical protein